MKNKSQKVRVNFYLDRDVADRLEKMSKLLGVSKSSLVNDLIDDASRSFFDVLNNGKDKLIPSVLNVLADKLKDVSKEFQGVSDESRD